jgi:hypothetical protein
MFFATQQIVKHIPTDTLFTFFGKTLQPVQNPKDLGWLNYGLKYIFWWTHQAIGIILYEETASINKTKNLFKAINSGNDNRKLCLFQAVLLFLCLVLNESEEHL